MGISDLIKSHVESGLFTDCFVGFGLLDRKGLKFKSELFSGDERIFDLASLTKALVTTPLIFKLLKDSGSHDQNTVGEILIKSEIIPTIWGAEISGITIKDLLAHTSGLPAWRNFWVHCEGENEIQVRNWRDRFALFTEKISQKKWPPLLRGKQCYSDIGFIILGLLIEGYYQNDLDAIFSAYCFDDLGIKLEDQLIFCPSKKGVKAISTGFCAVRNEELRGVVHDENCAAFSGISGHAGIFGTGENLALYLEQLAQSDIGKDVLKVNSEARVWPIGDIPNEGLLGFRQGADKSSEVFGGGKALGHLGFTGVAFWLVPEAKAYGMVLTNRVISGRQRPGIQGFRRAVFGELNHFLKY